ncbi:MAG: hypothetical protein GY950_03560 [bacterium]|nr:hypothetical protein [bacterium]
MARQIKTTEDYMGRLLKLIPSEMVAVYMAIQGFVPAEQAKLGLSIISVVILVLIPPYLKFIQKVESATQIIVSTLSFIIWLYGIGGPFVHFNVHEPWIASAVLLLWTTFVPQFFKSTPVSE